MQEHGHARQTCAKALRVLIHEGLLYRLPGLGTAYRTTPRHPARQPDEHQVQQHPDRHKPSMTRATRPASQETRKRRRQHCGLLVSLRLRRAT